MLAQQSEEKIGIEKICFLGSWARNRGEGLAMVS